MQLLNYLQSIINVSDELKGEIEKSVNVIQIKKGGLLVNIGERCTNMYFIEKGLLRGFYFNEEKEITNWFANEGEFATSFYSFISKNPSQENMQALEDCELIQIANPVLQKLYNRFPETERIGRIITETYYIKLEGRLLNIQFKSAMERYLYLQQTHPEILNRAALGQIASWLGITQETLSRIRSSI